MRHPGRVKSDKKAFAQILGRLESEVGGIIQLTQQAGQHPLWSLVRMLFPVADALADLLYQQDNRTSMNLKDLLANEFEAVRTGYADKAAAITVIYRHSLIHHDEIRILVASGKEVGWAVSNWGSDNHMTLDKGKKGINVRFDPITFYHDLVAVIKSAMKKRHKVDVKKRYNGWLKLDLDEKKRINNPKPNQTEKEALSEVASW
jgi:hypothetical protein